MILNFPGRKHNGPLKWSCQGELDEFSSSADGIVTLMYLYKKQVSPFLTTFLLKYFGSYPEDMSKGSQPIKIHYLATRALIGRERRRIFRQNGDSDYPREIIEKNFTTKIY